MILIRAQHLSYRTGGRVILNDVSIEIPAGGIIGVFGRNGSGKTALLKCLAGLETHTGGTISVEQKVKQSFAIQSAGLAAELTLAENLQLFAALSKVPPRRRTNRVASVIQNLGLAGWRNVPVGRLSRGILAKAEIARAFVADSRLVFIDGLLDALDDVNSEDVWNVIRTARREEGTAFVVATTRAGTADKCDWVALIHDGNIITQGTPSGLKAKMPANTIVVDGIRSPLIKSKIKKQFAVSIEEADGIVKLQSADTMNTALDLLAKYGSEVGAVYIRQPNLDDVLDDAIVGRLKID